MAAGAMGTSAAIYLIEPENACCPLQILMDNRNSLRKTIRESASVDHSRPHLKTLEEIERDCIPSLVEVLRTEGIDSVRYALWAMARWHECHDPCVWRSRATGEQKRIGWEMWVRMEKIICTVLDEAHKRQIEETMDAWRKGRRASTSSLDSFCRNLLLIAAE